MYPIEFRKAVLKYYDKNRGFKKTCELFDISQATLHSWLKKRKEGDPPPRRRGRKPSVARADIDQYIKEHPDAFQREIAEKFNCTQSCICKILKEIGYRFKKKTAVT